MIGDYPTVAVLDENKKTVGYSFIRPYHPAPAFRRTGEITYFVAPERTSKGIGTSLQEHMGHGAREMEIDTLLAFVVENNEPSICFHKQNGFENCGRLVRIGRKSNQDLTILCFQKFI